MYKSYEQAKEEIEKLRQELYPQLFSNSNEKNENPSLEPIAEDTNELTDTHNDLTEDTSEAFASDDEVRGLERNEDDEDQNNTDDRESIEQVIADSTFNTISKKKKNETLI